MKVIPYNLEVLQDGHSLIIIERRLRRELYTNKLLLM